MKLRVYRYLYLANRRLLEAVNALGELRREPAFRRNRLRQGRLKETQSLIEEARASMNSDLAEWIDQHETDRASRLDLERWKNERWKREKEDVPPMKAKRPAEKPRGSKQPAKHTLPSRPAKVRRA